MLGIVVLGLVVLREGLAIRGARMRGRAFDSRRHRRLAKLLVALLALGWTGGLASMVLLRNQGMFESIHWPFGTTALLLIIAAGALGLRMERAHTPGQRSLHATLGALGMLLALGATVAGMSILP